MSPNKTPGLNWMTVGFYKKYWKVVGLVITKIILEVLNKCERLRAINQTNVVLIPKKKDPTTTQVSFDKFMQCYV